MSYDAEAHGALCSRCPLAEDGEGFSPPELRDDALGIIVGEAPGETECKEGRPFVGASGQELSRALHVVGSRRGDFAVTNALLCRPPDNDLKRYLHDIGKRNKKRKKAEREPIADPIACCHPRLAGELRRYDNVIALGGTALRAVLGASADGAPSILAVRGGPIRGEYLDDGRLREDPAGPVRILPTLHPSFVLRARGMTHAFRIDLGRALRFFRGETTWKDPKTVYAPRPAWLRRFFTEVPGDFITYDVETDEKEPLSARLRCVGFATAPGDHACVVPLLSVDGKSQPWYDAREEHEVREVMRAFFAGPRLKVGHNAGYYDRMVIEAHLGVTPKPLLDTILLHRGAESELPHSLGYIGSVYTDVDSWKQGHTATQATTDEELWLYNAKDCAVTARVVMPLFKKAKAQEQAAIVKFDHQIQDVCVGLHRNGMFVDQKVRAEWDVKLEKDAVRHRRTVQEYVHDYTWNPGSVERVKGLLFEDWGLPPHHFTALGEPSTDDESLRSYLVGQRLDPERRAVLAAIREYRRAVKFRGTYVTKLRPKGTGSVEDALAEDEEESWEERQERQKRGKLKEGIVWADGRMRPDYNAHGTTSGRLSSSNPNAQNFPRKLRNMICAAPGHVLVGADMSQLELRLAAALARTPLYLQIFNSGGDPHAESARMVFRERAAAVYAHAVAALGEKAKKDPDWARMRDFAKRFTYACIYGASEETIHDVIASVEDDHGNLIYKDVTLSETTESRRNWLGANPEIERWWESEVAEFRRQKFLAEPVLGRRRYFIDGEERNEILNFKCQSAGSAIVHLATLDLVHGPLPFECFGPGTGLIQQGHDSLVFEVPEDKGEWALGQIVAAMHRRVPGLDVDFPAEGKLGRRWSDV